MLSIGVPKEIKVGERRVSLTPEGVQTLTQQKIPVYVEENTGLLSGFSNESYKEAGAILISNVRELWKKSDIIKKVKEPIGPEFDLFESRHIIFTYLHLASPAARNLINAFHKSKATGIAYETIEVNGQFPLLAPMSEIAGVLAAYYAGIFKNVITTHDKKISGLDEAKKLMVQCASKFPEIPKNFSAGTVLILGGGFVGEQAARTAALMGSKVIVSELSPARRDVLKNKFSSEGLHIQFINPEDKIIYETALLAAEAIIGAVHVGGRRAPVIIDSNLLRKMGEAGKKVMIDVSIDQGGNIAESRPTDYENPLYLDSYGNVRFSVSNMPSLAGKGASMALEKVSLEYASALANGLKPALERFPELKSGINVLNGELVHPAVIEVFNK